MYTKKSPTFHFEKNLTEPRIEEIEHIQTSRETLDYSFEIKITELSQNEIMLKLIIPDLTEILLIVSGLILNYVIMQPITRLNLFNPYMLIFWGILTLMLTTGRWGYSSYTQFLARQKTFESKLMQGKQIVDFNLFGMGISGLLIVLGVYSAGLI